jgi:hypothetical protein
MPRPLHLCPLIAVILALAGPAAAQDDEPAAPEKPKPRRSKLAAGRCGADQSKCVCGRPVKRRWARVAKRFRYIFYRCDDLVAWYPTVAYRLDFGPTFGLRAFHKDLFGHREAAVFTVRLGGRYIQFYSLDMGFPRLRGGRYYAATSASFSDAGNLIFRGLGNAVPVAGGVDLDPRDGSVETRFKRTVTTLTGRAGRNLGRARRRIQIGGLASVNILRFGDIDADTPGVSIAQVYDISKLPGFTRGASVLELLAEVIYDGRDIVSPLGQGWQLRAFAGGAPPLGEFRYTRHGGELVYNHRLGRRHVLSGRLVHETVFGDDSAIPFTKRPRLGGVNLLRGYAEGSLRDRLAIVGVARYEFPIYRTSVAGAVFADAGKVGASYGDLLGARNLRDHWQPGFGAGLILQPTPDIRIRLAAAQGDGFQIRFTSTLASFSHGRGYFP